MAGAERITETFVTSARVIGAVGPKGKTTNEITPIIPEFTIHRTDGHKNGPLFINFPGSPITGETSVLTTARAKNASHRVITLRNFTDPKRSGERMDAVEETEGFALAGESSLTLSRDFPLDPNQENYFSQERILERLRRSTFLPRIPKNLSGNSLPAIFIRQVINQANDDAYWDNDGAELATAFDNMSYGRIGKEYKTKEPANFFDSRISEAYQIIQGLITDKLPEERRTMGALTRAALIASPSELVRYALTAMPRLQYETLRTLNVAEMLAISDKEKQGLKPLISRFNREINNQLYEPDQDHGATQVKPVYAIFHKETGKRLWDSRTDKKLTQAEYEHYHEVGIARELRWNVNSVPIVGEVFTDPRFKDEGATVEKMIRDAESRERLVGDDYVEPTGVTDLGGIMHVLLDETDVNGAKINRFIADHVKLAKATFGDEVVVRVRDSKSSGDGKSVDHRFRRVDILIPKRDGSNKKHKIEMIFVTLQDYLKNEYLVGTPHPSTGILNGPAHRIYEKIRRTAAARRMLPKSVFGDVDIDWNEITKKEVDIAAAALANEDQIPFEKLIDEGYAPPTPAAEMVIATFPDHETAKV